MDLRRMMTRVLGILLLSISMFSCSSNNTVEECLASNTNDILLKGEFDRPEYQNVMLANIEVYSQKVHYFFHRRNEHGQIVLKAVGPDFCGYLNVDVEKEDAITEKLQNNSGYSGAELEKFQFVQDGEMAIWESAGDIID